MRAAPVHFAQTRTRSSKLCNSRLSETSKDVHTPYETAYQGTRNWPTEGFVDDQMLR